MSRTLQPKSNLIRNHEDALALLAETRAKVFKSISSPSANAMAINYAIARLDRVKLYLERVSTALEPIPRPEPTGDRKPRLKPELRAFEARHSDERRAIAAHSVRERRAFAAVPSFLCCIALPVSRVTAPPMDWAIWARLSGLPLPLPRITRQTIKAWKRWAAERLIEIPDWKVTHPAAEWLAWAAGHGATLPPPHITSLTIDRWRQWAAERKIPAPVANTYVRESGRFRIEMTSSPTFGCPYGIYPRRLIVGIATCVKQMQQQAKAGRTVDTRIVHLGETCNDAIRKLLGADYNVGGTAGRRFREQFHALINSRILWWRDIEHLDDYQTYSFAADLDRNVPLDPELRKHLIFETRGMTLQLGEHFHRDCLNAAPIDYDLFDKLADQGNCLAVDVYLWLTFRAWHLKQSRRVELPPISWQSLKIQFGTSYTDLRTFRFHFRAALELVTALYPAMEWRETETRNSKSILEAKVIVVLKEPSVQCAYTGFATGTADGSPRRPGAVGDPDAAPKVSAPKFLPPAATTGNLFE